MNRKELKSLRLVRRSLKKEIGRVDDIERKISSKKSPHAFALGYLEVMRQRRRDARDDLVRVKKSIAELKSGAASERGKPARVKKTVKCSSANSAH
jgi:hypothetical protein